MFMQLPDIFWPLGEKKLHLSLGKLNPTGYKYVYFTLVEVPHLKPLF